MRLFIIMIKLCSLSFGFGGLRRAKIYKKPLYEAIPHFQKPHFIDIHDEYQYRTRKQVMKQLQTISIIANCTTHFYSPAFPQSTLMNRKAIIQFSVKDLRFSHLQLERFKILMGPRFNEKTGRAKMVCQMYPEYRQNFQKLTQQIQEVVLESKRAP